MKAIEHFVERRGAVLACAVVLVWAALGALTPTRGLAQAATGQKPYDRETAKQLYRRPAAPPFPADNPHTPAREALGKALFFDPRLSAANSISCASCHNPAFSWGDGLPKGVGHGSKEVGRRTPTILNVAWGELFFWDGRAASLEEQALGPIAAPGEMNLPLDQMVARLKAIHGYHPLFEAAYPGEGISEKTVAKAIATFERTVVSGIAPFDEWIAGRDSAISPAAQRGFDLFNTKAECAKCHTGWNFTDDGFHDIGLADADRGRGVHLPQLESMQHAFKTPTLRNVRLRAPYMHDGSEKTLEDVVSYYNKGGTVRRPSVSPDVRPLHLTAAEMADLVAFLDTLTSQDPPVVIPVLPRGEGQPRLATIASDDQ
ncbi:MAG TPA: cytochrome c peroxidase [Methylomirabilota bacterium]|nr:cytochrome c peroxidase [Methylomirabilota bacterium]